MDTNIRMTLPTMRVLELFLLNVHKGLSGADIAKETGLLSGTLYPILHRLEQCGWLMAEEEQVDPSEVGRPKRRFYYLKGEAQSVAHEALARRGYLAANKPILGGVHGLA